MRLVLGVKDERFRSEEGGFSSHQKPLYFKVLRGCEVIAIVVIVTRVNSSKDSNSGNFFTFV